MKRWIVITLLAGLSLSSMAEVLERWTYDEVAGKAIHECVNNGSVGTTWGWGDVKKWATDGNGNLSVAPTNGADYKASNLFPAALETNQTYTMEIKIAEWDIPAAAPDSTVKWRLRTDASSAPIISIQTVLTTSGLSFTLISDGTNYRNHPAGGTSGSNATAKVVFNPAAGWATYYVNGAEKETFTGLTLDPLEKFQMSKEGDWTTINKVLKIDEQTLSNADQPEGTYVVDKYTSTDIKVAETNIVKTFTAQSNDVIVVVTASTSKEDPAETNIVFGGTASLDPVTYAPADPYKGCRSSYWYTKATTDGTVSLEVQRGDIGYFIVGAYQLRAGTGYTAPALVGSPLTAALNGVTSITNTYALGTNYTGVCIEALSTYAEGFEPVSPEITANGVGYGNKRNVASGTFSGVASLDSIWATTNAPNQLTWVGLAFGSTPDGIVPTPQEQFDTWLAGYSVGGDTGLTDDPDGDLLNNLVEYAFGGAPDNVSDQGNTPVQSMVEDGGTNYLEYIYYERTDAAYRQLSSLLEVGNDLVITNWADGSSYETGRGASGVTDFDAVTNRIPTDSEAKQFIKLDIQLGN